MIFEVVVIPVADVDRSKAFYTKLGWRLDADFPFGNGCRVVQFTPPGSMRSVQFGTKMTTAASGSARGLYLIVSDLEAARKELVTRGIDVSEVFHTLDVATLTELLRKAEQHHGDYEPTAPKHHWSGWYAAYIVARQEGKTPEEAAKKGKFHIEGSLL
jgi:catechol 2,3-dioxygenase-like lactoylglutathione lyase family enzyme